MKRLPGGPPHPVLTLPSELVSRVFWECLPAHGRIRPSPTKPPLLLTQICHDWREIATSSSELWSSVDLCFSTKWTWGLGQAQQIPNNGALPLLQQWFERANARPLSVTIRSSHKEIPYSILSLISSAAEKLHSLELHLSHKDYQLLRENPIALPGLRRLAVLSSDKPHDGCNPLSIFADAPLLSELTTDATRLNFHYPTLTSLDLCGRVGLETVLAVLKRCHRLLHLSAFLDERSISSKEVVTAPYLQSLKLHGGGGLDNLTLPGLRSLEIDMGFTATKPRPPLPAFLERSSCSLKHLALFGNTGDVGKSLGLLPWLTSLEINVVAGMARFAELMMTKPLILPNLTTLNISAAYDPGYRVFIQLLNTRRQDQSSLVNVELHLTELDMEDWLPASVTEALDKLISGGLKLWVVCDDDFSWPHSREIDFCATFP
ncbi:hypothetical protein B0H14DRAFT_1646418 [Mycena olivaceomarginata]|nr:hypothetical protein B0H14DRAFT_1646418 [Mycena olivaceomarginata]